MCTVFVTKFGLMEPWKHDNTRYECFWWSFDPMYIACLQYLQSGCLQKAKATPKQVSLCSCADRAGMQFLCTTMHSVNFCTFRYKCSLCLLYHELLLMACRSCLFVSAEKARLNQAEEGMTHCDQVHGLLHCKPLLRAMCQHLRQGPSLNACKLAISLGFSTMLYCLQAVVNWHVRLHVWLSDKLSYRWCWPCPMHSTR